MTRSKKRKAKYQLGIIFLLFAVVISFLIFYLSNNPLAVLSPGGIIAAKQRNLMITTTFLMLLIVVPVFILTFAIAWRYRAGNKKAKYTPEWDRNPIVETIWWTFPFAIILVLGIIIWNSTHQLNPRRPIDSPTKALNVQVVAMNWKWLFIYPEQRIATVNYVQFPEATPISFEITADAPMNSFWIPRLGGQIYAMAGMKTKLYLMADQKGEYKGLSANMSGPGFAGMKFVAKSSSSEEFNKWVKDVKRSNNKLNFETYNELSKPSQNNAVATYQLEEQNLYDDVIMKYMIPMEQKMSKGVAPNAKPRHQ